MFYLKRTLIDKQNHVNNPSYDIEGFWNDVAMNKNGKLLNGIQPAECICKQIKTTVYVYASFSIISLALFLIYVISYAKAKCCK